MFAKIKHLAIISDNYALLSRFYEALFFRNVKNPPMIRVIISPTDESR